MSLAIYLDDCAFSYKLRQLLRDSGHDVTIPADIDPPLTGKDDAEHLAYARSANKVILTYNAKDFLDLHNQDPRHSGIFVVYQDNDITKDMSYRDIVQAIKNLENTHVQIENGFWPLNAYRW